VTRADWTRPYIQWNRQDLVNILDDSLADQDLTILRARIKALREDAEAKVAIFKASYAPPSSDDERTAVLRQDIFIEELNQILEAKTLKRAKYYLTRLRRGILEVQTTDLNDINLNRWKAYEFVRTDSLWVIDRRDTSGAHEAWYWGNFIPEIPRQMMLRYTRAGEWVLDPFVGSGTTLIECRRLGRCGLGVELNPKVADHAKERLVQESNPHQVVTGIEVGDSRTIDFKRLLRAQGIAHVQLLMMHPPYHDIIQFSKNENDLSNAPSVDAFMAGFSEVVQRTYPLLESGRYLAVVIGDKYQGGTWIPLGFRVMNAVLDHGYRLKSIVVKNLDRTRAKREQAALWRYRALAGGFYVFKHEYLLIFEKP
jgi:DNA modification methylase